MIQDTSLQQAHLLAVQSSFSKLSPRLFEKTSRALKILELMVNSGRPFIFKGGTALMLLLQNPTRLSIDLDIILEEEVSDVSAWIASFLPAGYRLETSGKGAAQIPKKKYKIHYQTVLEGEPEEDNIIIDVLFEQNRYARTIDTPIKLPFLAMDGEPVYVKTPDLSSILGDKLTAFAPRTVGVHYIKSDGTRSELDVIKQMHDVGVIVKHLGEDIKLDEVSSTYRRYVELESQYFERVFRPSETLQDSIDTAYCVISNGSLGDVEANKHLRIGLEGLSQYIFGQGYSRSQYVLDASLACWLATALKQEGDLRVFHPSEVGSEQPRWQKHEKIMKNIQYDAPEALPYWTAIQKMRAR